MRLLLFSLPLLAAGPASAEVLSASPTGFEVQEVVNLVVPQPSAYAAFGQVGQWWNKEHTYSGEASRMSLQLACHFSSGPAAVSASRSKAAAASSICG